VVLAYPLETSPGCRRSAQRVEPVSQPGEVVRLIRQPVAELGIPGYDFCLFDGRTGARMNFGDHSMTGAEIIEDADSVARHRARRDAAQQHAVSLETYRAGQR
jgi:hypothetical protein